MPKTSVYKTKAVGYAYATSLIAKKFNLLDGCWYVSASVDDYQSIGDVKFASVDKAEVLAHAGTIEAPYSTYSMHDEKYK